MKFVHSLLSETNLQQNYLKMIKLKDLNFFHKDATYMKILMLRTLSGRIFTNKNKFKRHKLFSFLCL